MVTFIVHFYVQQEETDKKFSIYMPELDCSISIIYNHHFIGIRVHIIIFSFQRLNLC